MQTFSLVILTGVSGSGKSTALKAFEDLGYFCVENLPSPLVPHFVDFLNRQVVSDGNPGTPETGYSVSPAKRYALLVDCREIDSYRAIRTGVERLKKVGAAVSMLFFDCQDDVLLRRFRETRRPHPLLVQGSGETISEALLRERALLAEGRAFANRIIDTSAFTPHELRTVIEAFVGGGSSLEVTLLSFGYKHGVPSDADLLVDVRFLPNPHFVPDLKPKRGTESEVREYVFHDGEAEEFLEKYKSLLEFLIPRYRREGKRYVTVAIGCTGGHHRSVAIAEKLGNELKHSNVIFRVRHRDIER